MTSAPGTEELGNGFRFHGVATPVSNHRGTVATVDGAGRDVVLVWLFDHRGGYALLLLDAQTGAGWNFRVAVSENERRRKDIVGEILNGKAHAPIQRGNGRSKVKHRGTGDAASRHLACEVDLHSEFFAQSRRLVHRLDAPQLDDLQISAMGGARGVVATQILDTM